ncbi:MAG: Tol-Pal system beta propeller repeat protein TolB, partial [Thiohalomonadales bacterium]
ESDIKFRNWRVLGSESLVIGQIEQVGDDKYKVSFWLFDVFKAKKLAAFSINTNSKSLRTTAHKISDLIYEKLLNEPGAFSTYILYITSLRASERDTSYTLWMADFDGERPQKLTGSKFPILSPSWSPDGKRIAYASLEGGGGGKQKVIIQEWRTARRTIVTTIKEGLYGAPAWSPDGKHLSFTISLHGNSDIYRLNLSSKRLKQLTNHWAIDTESVWTPDGKSIIFTSDRSGRPQLYKMPSNGGKVSRLTFEGKSNSKPVVSSDGKLLAMVENIEGKYKIALMNMASGNVQILTDGDLDESPSFAPNTGMIIYATTVGQRKTLATVSTDGRFKQSLDYAGDVRSPAWSPLNIR